MYEHNGVVYSSIQIKRRRILDSPENAHVCILEKQDVILG